MPHAEVIASLTEAFHRQLDRTRVQFIGSTFGLVIRKEPLTCRSPDIAVFERATIVNEDGYIHSAPQLVIEVLSPTERAGKSGRSCATTRASEWKKSGS